MKIKLGKFEADIPMTGVIIVALIVDNMYANHCDKKSYGKLVNETFKDHSKKEEES